MIVQLTFFFLFSRGIFNCHDGLREDTLKERGKYQRCLCLQGDSLKYHMPFTFVVCMPGDHVRLVIVCQTVERDPG